MNFVAFNGLWPKGHAVLGKRNIANVLENLFQMRDFMITMPQQVYILGGSMRLTAPYPEQRCPIQDELMLIGRLTEPI